MPKAFLTKKDAREILPCVCPAVPASGTTRQLHPANIYHYYYYQFYYMYKSDDVPTKDIYIYIERDVFSRADVKNRLLRHGNSVQIADLVTLCWVSHTIKAIVMVPMTTYIYIYRKIER